MEDKKMDDLFKKELESPKEFFNSNEQWKIVEKQLITKRTKRFWFITFIFVLFGFCISYLGFQYLNLVNSISMKSDNALIIESLSKENSIDLKSDNNKQLGINSKSINRDSNMFKNQGIPSRGLEPHNRLGNIVENQKEKLTIDGNSEKIKNFKLKKQAIKSVMNKKSNDIECDDCTIAKSNLESNMEQFSQSDISIEKDREYDSTTLEHHINSKLKNQIITNEIASISIIPNIVRYLDDDAMQIQLNSVTSIITEKYPIEINNRLKFGIFAGISKDVLNYTTTIDSSALIPYFGISYNFSNRIKLSISYSQYNVNRRITSDSLSYRIPAYNPIVYGSYVLDHIDVKYFNQAIDWSFMLNVYKHQSLNLNFEIGGQLNRLSQFSNGYLYKNEYDENLVINKINDVNFSVSDLVFGMQLEIPIIYNIGIVGGYKVYFPIHNQSFRWLNRHRVNVGLNFNF